jgi:hypothetical protein
MYLQNIIIPRRVKNVHNPFNVRVDSHLRF